jgi:hypothetical protein
MSVATAVPAHAIEQCDVAEAARQCFGERHRDFNRLARVFLSSGMLRRHAVRSLEWYLEPLGLGGAKRGGGGEGRRVFNIEKDPFQSLVLHYAHGGNS